MLGWQFNCHPNENAPIKNPKTGLASGFVFFHQERKWSQYLQPQGA